MRRHVCKILAIALMMTMTMSSLSFAAINLESLDEGAMRPEIISDYQHIAGYPNLWNNDVDYVSCFFLNSYFKSSPVQYNRHLATASMSLNMAGGTYHDTYIHELLNDLGCEYYKEYEYTGYNYTLHDDDQVGVAIAYKKLNDNNYLVPIVVRGSGYGSEWALNFITGTEGNSAGFSKPADKIVDKYVDEIVQRIKGLPNYEEGTTKIKFWITGYSRGGAIANLAAAKLTEIYNQDNVYAYTFEAPKGVYNKTAEDDEKYKNIHNVVNVNDGIALVLPTYMGFSRYGVDHEIGDGDETLMFEKLKELVPSIKLPSESTKDSDKVYYSYNDLKWGKFRLNIDLNSPNLIKDVAQILEDGSIYSVKKVSDATADEIWNETIKRLKKEIPTRESYGGTQIQTGFVALMKFIYSMTKAEEADFKNAVLNANTILSLVSDVNLVRTLGAIQDGRMPLMNDSQYTNMANHIASAIMKNTTKLDSNQKADFTTTCQCLLKPAVSVLAKDFKNEHQLIGTLMINHNLDRIKQFHFFDTNMAWLMTQDSYYNGFPPQADEYVEKTRPEIVVANTNLSGLCTGIKKFNVKWEKQSDNLDGYQLQYTTDRNFKENVNRINISDSTIVSKKVTNLKHWKRYYVRIRCYKKTKSNDKKYGEWSKIKSVFVL